MKIMKLSGMAVATVMVTWLSFFLARTSNVQNFDFFYLAMQWPPAVCNQPRTDCRTSVPKNFTIHGMWPQTYSGGSPQNCSGAVDDVRKELVNRTTLQALMDRQWPNLKGVPSRDANSEFWTREWNKHGTCSAWSLQVYFQTTVDRAASVDLLRNLWSKRIQPNNGSYQRSDISEALRVYSPVVQCNKVSGTGGSYNQIHEIRLCVQKDGSGFSKCVGGTHFNNCGGGTIMFSS